MELLKELLETLKDTPSMAVWVLAIYFAHKALIVYAAYGFGRYVVGKAHETITFKKVVEVEVEKLFVYPCHFINRELNYFPIVSHQAVDLTFDVSGLCVNSSRETYFFHFHYLVEFMDITFQQFLTRLIGLVTPVVHFWVPEVPFDRQTDAAKFTDNSCTILLNRRNS